MASGTAPTEPTRPVAGDDARGRGAGWVDYDEFVEQRIRETQRQVRTTDLLTSGSALLAGGLVYLLLFSVLDYWVVSGGVGFWGRAAALAIFVAGFGVCGWRYVVRPYLRRINPLYAAEAIERSEPRLKNGVLNFLMLRRERTQVAPAVFQGVKHQAARGLSQVDVESAVDRTRAIHVLYLLLGVVAVFCALLLMSPNTLLRSIGRMAMPWSDLAPPTRVRFGDVQPGSTSEFYGEHIEVLVSASGVRDGESVRVVYSTADGQVVDRAVEMEFDPSRYRYVGVVPAEARGLQQPIIYRIEGGDARTPEYRIEVVTAPAILVRRVEFDYPDYTRLATRTVERQGDLRAIEGTRITIDAEANRDVARAALDFDSDGTEDLSARFGDTPREVSFAPFALALDEQGDTLHESYVLRFEDENGVNNEQPIRHKIEVVADRPPEVAILEPAKSEIEVAVNGTEAVVFEAEDPDFALRGVTVYAARGEDRLLAERTLDGLHVGRFRGSYLLTPKELGVSTGETIELWIEARDNRQTESKAANHSQTVRYRIHVVDEVSEAEAQEQRAEAEEKAEEEEDEDNELAAQDAGEGPVGDPFAQDAEDTGVTEAESSEESNETSERIDPESNAGDAFEEILKHREEQEQDESTSNEDSGDAENEGSTGESAGDESVGESEDGQETDAEGEEGGGDAADSEEEGGAENRGNEKPETGEDRGTEPADEGREGGDDSQSESESGEQNGDSESGAGGEETSGGTGNNGEESGESGAEGSGGEENGGESNAGGAEGEESSEPGSEAGEASEGPQEGTGGDERPSMNGESSDANSDSEPGGDGGSSRSGDETGEGSDAPSADAPAQNDASRGQGGEGRSSEQPGVTPDALKENQPRRGDEESENSEEAPAEGSAETSSPSQSKTQSETEGEDSGDRSGSGKEGGGQQADQAGQGTSGSNSDAEEGAGQSSQSGEGEGTRASEQGDQSGEGGERSSSGEGQTGAGQGGDAGKPPAGEGESQGEGSGSPSGGGGESGANAPSASEPDGGETPQGGAAAGSGTAGGTDAPPEGEGSGGAPGDNPEGSDAAPSEPGRETTNLDYANRATDLALDYLEHELNQPEPDPELLERLGWTREEMQAFVERWKRIKQAAQESSDDGAAKQELDEALRRLGLRPRGASTRSGSSDDTDANLRQRARSQPPVEYREQFQGFSESTARRRPRD